ncbi:MAG: AzlC family ABC transporter permease [Clostridiaceae bacterium]|nr:AzlC family ABC transporter permease [Clostridiaceae bacterium]
MKDKSLFFRKGLKDGIPIALGYLAVSFSLGIAAKNSGLTASQATVMSITNSTSAGEFAALALIESGSSYVEMAILQLIINIRYCLMSCALSQKIETKLPLLHRMILSAYVTDEIFAVSVTTEGKLNPFYTYGVMSISVPAWALGTCLGVISGGIISPRILSALSIALYGMFIAIIIPPTRKNRVLASIIVISMFGSFVFQYAPLLKDISSGFKIIILTVSISVIAAILFPVKEVQNEE